MAVSSFAGSFTMNASTGNQSVTGLGFQPKIIFFWSDGSTADGTGVNIQGTHGIAVSATDRRCVGYSTPDNNSPGSGGNMLAGHYTDRIIRFCRLNGDTAALREADFVSMDADGFTINIGTTDGTQSIVNYCAYGGDDITNVKTGQFQQPGSTGNTAYTGIGFQPDCLIYFRGRSTGTAPSATGNSPPRASWGFATSASARGVLTTQLRATGSAFTAKTYQRTTKVVAGMGNSDTVQEEADLVSFDADGFTLNWSTTSVNVYVFYAVMKGGQYKVGSFNQATGTGNQATTGVGFQPASIFLVSSNKATDSAVNADCRITIGAASSTSQRATSWHGQDDGTTNSDNAHALDRDETIQMYTEPTPTLNAEGDLVSLDSDGFTLNWSTADATAREILYLAIGSLAVAGGQPIARRVSTIPFLGGSLRQAVLNR